MGNPNHLRRRKSAFCGAIIWKFLQWMKFSLNFLFLLKLVFKNVPETGYLIFCGSLRARMTNSGNERKIYSAHFDSYVGFQNDVKNCLNIFKNFSWT